MFDPSNGVGLFTDGSCYWADRIGSWGWVAFDADGNELYDADRVRDTTSNRMEMTAVIMALQKLSRFGKLDVFIWSDSEYVVLGNLFPERNRKKNLDLWDDMEAAKGKHKTVKFEHVKGHEDSHYNIFVDSLASNVRKLGTTNGMQNIRLS